MGHLHCPTHKHEDNEHAVDLTCVYGGILMTVSRVVSEVNSLSIVAVSAETHVQALFRGVDKLWSNGFGAVEEELNYLGWLFIGVLPRHHFEFVVESLLYGLVV